MISNQSIGTWIERRARIAPDDVAVIFGNTRLTYADMAGRVRRLAHQLRALGVKRTDRVGWLGPNHPAFLEILFATAKIGAVLAPINHRLERETIEAICSDVAPRVVFLDASLSDVRLPPVVAAAVTVGQGDAQENQYERLIANGPDEPIDELVTFDDLWLDKAASTCGWRVLAGRRGYSVRHDGSGRSASRRMQPMPADNSAGTASVPSRRFAHTGS